eukprot:CAMPEP_0115837118 /NCGR_PEP_ID=MMETSP0287-20121206/5056_1 /TAXON_ID=412157 /ORGANISM="Chrysochromulina rotalis, Strain UIO044" /LENGTH=93 /DNA_ID=CAMNT_0003290619 /DNA_START=165 /DNA_END=447 /DNA_ORIENTATION=-
MHKHVPVAVRGAPNVGALGASGGAAPLVGGAIVIDVDAGVEAVVRDALECFVRLAAPMLQPTLAQHHRCLVLQTAAGWVWAARRGTRSRSCWA